MGINVAQLVRQWAVRAPERIAVVLADAAGSELAFGELDVRARRAAATLQRRGLVPGDRIAISLKNGIGFLDAWFGGLYAGCTILPIPPMSAVPELSHRLRHAQVKALITDASTAPLAEGARRDVHVASLDVEELGDSPGDHRGPVDLPADAVAMILYTSGTTGTPKGAMITHASLLTHTAALVHHVLRLTPDDVVMATLPLTHSYGIRMTLLAPFYAGACSVLLERFSPQRVAALLESEHVTWFPGVPTMFHALAHHRFEAGLALPNLKWCLSAGAPLPRSVRLAAQDLLGVPVRQGFGLTEGTFSTVATPDDPRAEDSVGKPVFGVEVRIMDAHGRELPAGHEGEICIRGQNVMAGYLHDTEASAEVLRDGWLRSGDIGVLDKEGRLWVVDRLKDMIIRGGFNVYPAEVEAALLLHPSVCNAVVVGVPDERYGEEVAAVLMLKPGAALDAAQIDSHCRTQLSRTKLPRLVGTLPTFPVGPSGKVQRRAVRALIDTGEVTLQPLARDASAPTSRPHG